MKRRQFFFTGLATAGFGVIIVANPLSVFASENARLSGGRIPGEAPQTPHCTSEPTSFRIGVESVLPGEGWWGTIYGRFPGATYYEEMWVRSLEELGADFTLFYDSLAPSKPGACERITDICSRHGMDYHFNNTYGDIYGPWKEGTGRAEYSDVQLKYAAGSKEFKGIILDEVEHRQINHLDCGPGPYFTDVTGLTLQECYDKVLDCVTNLTSRYKGRCNILNELYSI